MRKGGTLDMTEPDCDYPREAEIQRRIEMRDYEGALELSLLVFGSKINIKCIHSLQGYVDDPISEAEYLTQIIFFEFYLALKRYDPDISGIRTFLHTIARYKIIDRLREA